MIELLCCLRDEDDDYDGEIVGFSCSAAFHVDLSMLVPPRLFVVNCPECGFDIVGYSHEGEMSTRKAYAYPFFEALDAEGIRLLEAIS